jgi:putative ABC transport system permease protein
VLIINETMADRFWPNEDPIGKNVRLLEYGKVPWLTVVGVVKDSSYYGPVEGPRLQMYVPFLATPWDAMYLVVHTEVDPISLAGSVQREVWTIDKDVPVDKLLTMGQLLSSKLSLPRFNMLLVSIFAALALLSAVLGTYGIMAYSVTERTHEFAVRVALGARPSDIFKLIIRQGTILALTGISIGVSTAFALTRVMAGLLYEVTTGDPLTFVSVSLLLAMVALLASYIPGRRATKVDPMVALRHE